MPRKKTDPELEAAEEQVVTASKEAAEPAPRRSYPQTRSSDDILTINDQERGITPGDSDDVKWNYITGAYSRREILTGIVSGLESLETAHPICVVDFEGVRILIPGRQMFMDEWPANERMPREFLMRFNRILGATIEFIVVGVDSRNHAAVASRKSALQQRQAKYYATGRVKPGIRIACRVIGVGNNRITVEAVGVDTTIYANALSWEWFPDVTDLYSTEDLVVARVLAVDMDEETGEYAVRLSVKAATENPDLPNLRKLVPGSNYYGVVTGVRDQLIFVRLQMGVNAKTKLFHTKQMPSKLDTVSFQVRDIDEENGVAFGLITRIIRRHARTR